MSSYDADWYRYHGNDTLFCQVNATFSLGGETGARLCAFASCGVSCPSGTKSEKSPGGGRAGCCDDDGFGIELSCPGFDDDSDIYLRVEKTRDECVSYTLGYHY